MRVLNWGMVTSHTFHNWTSRTNVRHSFIEPNIKTVPPRVFVLWAFYGVQIFRKMSEKFVVTPWKVLVTNVSIQSQTKLSFFRSVRRIWRMKFGHLFLSIFEIRLNYEPSFFDFLDSDRFRNWGKMCNPWCLQNWWPCKVLIGGQYGNLQICAFLFYGCSKKASSSRACQTANVRRHDTP